GGERAGGGGRAALRAQAGDRLVEHAVAVARLDGHVHTGRSERCRGARVPGADAPQLVARLECELDDSRGLTGGWGEGGEGDGAAVGGGGEAGGGEAPGGERERQAARAGGSGAWPGAGRIRARRQRERGDTVSGDEPD